MSLRDDIAALRYAIEALIPVLQTLAPVPPVEAYPIGSLFFSSLPDDPAGTLGYGSWESYGTGRVVVGVDPGQPEFETAGMTGGEKTHTLTTAELPGHAHAIGSRTLGTGTETTYEHGTIDTTSTEAPEGIVTGPVGGDQPHNNMPPYVVAYIWHRTS